MFKLGFGTMRLPLTDQDAPGSIDIPEFARMADRFIEKGGTYFDTAWMYHDGKSEEGLKAAVTSRLDRSTFTVTSKLPNYLINCPEDADKVFNAQLERTGAGYFDVYLLHAVAEENVARFENNNCFPWLLEKRKQGIVKKAGFSFHGTPELLERLLTQYPWVEVVQLQLNYLDWEDPVVQARRCYETCVRHDKQVIVMEPVKGGRLASLPPKAEAVLRELHPDWSPASWALRYAAGLGNVWKVLSGMSNMEQMEENATLFNDIAPLNDAELKALEKVTEIMHELMSIHCTACSYCMVKCPQKIRIPALFRLYNDDTLEGVGGTGSILVKYKRATLEKGSSDCLGCEACENICPQHLPIRELLKTVGTHFEERLKNA